MYSSYDKERTRRNCCLKKYAIVWIKFPENVLIILFVGYLAKETGSKIFMAPFKNVIRLLEFEVGVNPINLSSDSCNIDCFFFPFFFFHVPKFKNKTAYIFPNEDMRNSKNVKTFLRFENICDFYLVKNCFSIFSIWIN